MDQEVNKVVAAESNRAISDAFAFSPVSHAVDGYPTLFQALLHTAVPASVNHESVKSVIAIGRADLAINMQPNHEVMPCMGTLCVTTELASALTMISKQAAHNNIECNVTMPYYIDPCEVSNFSNTSVTAKLSQMGVSPMEMMRHVAEMYRCRASRVRYCLLRPAFGDPAKHESDSVEVSIGAENRKLYSTTGYYSSKYLKQQELYHSGIWFATQRVVDMLRIRLESALWHIEPLGKQRVRVN